MNEKICKDYGDNPCCRKNADERYTMDFTDLEPGSYIYWCAVCGPAAHAMNAALQEKLKEGGAEFAQNLEAAIFAAELRRSVQ